MRAKLARIELLTPCEVVYRSGERILANCSRQTRVGAWWIFVVT